MALNPLSEYISGVKSLAFKLFGKKSDNSYEALKTNDFGALKTSNGMEIYGALIASRPAANTVPVGCVFMLVDGTKQIWQSDGTNWLVM